MQTQNHQTEGSKADPSLHWQSLQPFQSMPSRLVVVRHGESEANVINRAIRKKELEDYPPCYLKTPDREIRLSAKGRDQAASTGAWLQAQYPEGFDVIYVSDHTRAKETAAFLCLAAGWRGVKIRIDPLLGERNWGRFPCAAPELRDQIMVNRKRDPLHNPMPDGETLLETRHRSRELLDRCARHYSGAKVLVISHGEFMQALWGEIAHMHTEKQIEFFASKKGKIENCQVLEFASTDPESEELSKSFQWWKSSCPQRGKEGRWGGIMREAYSPEQLLKQVGRYPQLVSSES